MRTLLVAALLASGSVASHAQDDVWKANSNTATAVTGDIAIGTDRIVFANGAILRLVPVEGRPGVFKVEPPANPLLMNGNRLCGEQDVTYVVLALASNDDALFMKVFEGVAVPAEAVADANPQEGTCATYSFSR
ncbi:hypothetical protein SAMN04488498_115136 [Mesorhizobium albiziae]|uniref:Uncharacterized protein n=1 Tax=Neomesorhizobium albiziae TaxID=335020 RepID=A0A1I4D250_9HYPH|nr:hypothetical protein [Mesorhizobium albiziae]GLS28295.1 hypothetical protein GCM10007937_00020 [Mesorhizobium albiziae]SFK87774.1 hypothetical protein SAMN04488498_115136 [Mesorhizobium albiziae]